MSWPFSSNWGDAVDGKSLNDCDLDMLCGWAKIIDVSECMMDKPITRDFLEKKNKKYKKRRYSCSKK